jgi:hypothetical protein
LSIPYRPAVKDHADTEPERDALRAKVSIHGRKCGVHAGIEKGDRPVAAGCHPSLLTFATGERERGAALFPSKVDAANR